MMPSKSKTTAASRDTVQLRATTTDTQDTKEKPNPSRGRVSLSPQRNHRIDRRRATCRQIAGGERDEHEEQRGADEAEGIGWTHVVQEARHQACDAERTRDPEHDPRRREPRAVADHEPEHVLGRSGSRNGSGRMAIVSTMLKMALFTPMPS